MVNILQEVFEGITTSLKGMKVTLRELFSPGCTLQYPDERRIMPERLRGMVVNDPSRCIACNACVNVCPVGCIECEGEGKGKERRPIRFAIDYRKCCWCALCTEVCPTESIFMSEDYETVFQDRTQLIRDFCSNPIPPKPGDKKRTTKPLGVPLSGRVAF
ncbi:MAG TPA: NADH-quinone oxidoreductase subunit I [bacterium]|jgi:NADH-quinone oxidoreductase subunit I|nr:NADH-quinone oxidoreductase subunit I [bacterium]HQL63761.1 NADH-quinone oxidoreductase subunit I [bacterium]